MKRSSLEAMDLTLKESLIAFFLAILPSRLKVGVYKLGGAHIGRNVRIGIGSVVMADNFSKISIGDFTKIRNFTFIICKEVNIGKYVFIPMFVWIWGHGKLVMKNRSHLGSRVIIDLRRNNFYCGEYTGVAPSAIIYTHTHALPYTQGWWHILRDVVLEDHVLVGMKSIILPGVRIGRNSIIGAGSVVSRSVPPNSFAVGQPAKVVSGVDKFKKDIDSKELKRRTIEVAKDLVDYFDFELLSEESIGDAYIITFKRSTLLSVKVWRLLVADASSLGQNELYRLIEGDNIVLFSTSSVPFTISQQILLWYDLKNLKCCRLPNRFARDIWHFLYHTWSIVCEVESYSSAQ